MMQLLYDYCQAEQLSSPDIRPYAMDERALFGHWLKALRSIDQQKDIPGLGIAIGRHVQASHVGVTAYMAQNSPTLADFFSIPMRYINLWYQFTELCREQDETQMILSWEQPCYAKSGLYVRETAISQELIIALLWFRLQQLLGPEQAHFNWLELPMALPKDVRPYQIFQCPIRFSAPHTRVSLPMSMLRLPLQQPDAVLRQILQAHADKVMQQVHMDDNFIEHVNQLILAGLKQHRVSVHEVASQMHMSVRQLQKILKQRQCSFQQCLNNIRLELAKTYLKDPQMTVLDIAYLLAYSAKIAR